MPIERPTLSTLAAAVGGEVLCDRDPMINDVHHDSRAVTRGSLFVAIVGSSSDGHDHVSAAADTVAAACVQHSVAVDIPQIIVTDTRRALGVLAHHVHGHPSHHLPVVGITGTNGKTTVSYLLESIALAAGRPAGVVGTIEARIGGDRVETARTTPEASDLHRLLAAMVERHAGMAAIEVSSHAMKYHRVEGIRFAVAAFTNLSQDHLDFHGDMEEYFAAKASLFTAERARHAVVNTAGDWGRRLAMLVRDRHLPLTTVLGDDADIRALDVATDIDGSTFSVETPRGSIAVRLPMAGMFNVENAVVAAGCALQVGFDLDAIAVGLTQAQPVPGRVESIDAGQPFTVLVDYAHTPDAVDSIAREAGSLTNGRMIVVIGAGGDRDREKRPQMGAAAARYAEVVIVTSDNPRSEDPAEIARAVATGARTGHAEVLQILDRHAAISHAVSMADESDTVLILGKGHEQGQESKGVVVPFDDRTVALAALEKR